MDITAISATNNDDAFRRHQSPVGMSAAGVSQYAGRNKYAGNKMGGTIVFNLTLFLAVGFAPMPNRNDVNNPLVIIDGIDNPVITDANPPQKSLTSQFATA